MRFPSKHTATTARAPAPARPAGRAATGAGPRGARLLRDGHAGEYAAGEAADGDDPGTAAQEEGGRDRVGLRQARDQVDHRRHDVFLPAAEVALGEVI